MESNYHKYKESHDAWTKNNTKGYYLKLHLKNDADIIEKLESVDNKNGYIKQLIRDDIKASKNGAL